MTETNENDIPDEYKFVSMVRKFGISKIFLNFDFIPALILTIIISWFYLTSKNFYDMVQEISLTLIGANAGLLGIILAGFSIVIAMMDKEFIPFLKKFGIYQETIVIFVLTSIFISIALVSSILLSLSIPFDTYITKLLFPVTILFTFWGIFSIVLLLVIFLKDLAVLKGDFSEYISRKKG